MFDRPRWCRQVGVADDVTGACWEEEEEVHMGRHGGWSRSTFALLLSPPTAPSSAAGGGKRGAHRPAEGGAAPPANAPGLSTRGGGVPLRVSSQRTSTPRHVSSVATPSLTDILHLQLRTRVYIPKQQ